MRDCIREDAAGRAASSGPQLSSFSLYSALATSAKCQLPRVVPHGPPQKCTELMHTVETDKSTCCIACRCQHDELRRCKLCTRATAWGMLSVEQRSSGQAALRSDCHRRCRITCASYCQHCTSQSCPRPPKRASEEVAARLHSKMLPGKTMKIRQAALMKQSCCAHHGYT